MSISRKLSSRILAILLGVTTAFTVMPKITAYAAPVEESDGDQIALKEITENTQAVTHAYNAVMKARRTGNQADIDEALVLISALSPTNKIRLYLRLSRDYYAKNYRERNFRYFDVEKYLMNNDDVRLAALSEAQTELQLYEYALNHYLDSGIFEARKSETDFDPVIAILSEPATFINFALTKDSTPDAVYNAYSTVAGKSNTNGIKINWNVPNGSNKYYHEPLAHTLYIIKDTPAAVYAYEEEKKAEAAPAQDKPDTPTPTPTPEPVPPVPGRYYINNYSEDISPYKLYLSNTGSYQFNTNMYSYPYAYNMNMPVTVSYNADNYATAKALSNNKDYTLMIYMCGTDQELKETYRRVTMQITSMLQADDLSNVNVLLFLGGTEHYDNTYLEDSNSKMKSGIYYLNPQALSDEVRTNLKQIDISSDDLIPIMEGKKEDHDGIAHGLKFNDVINSDTLIQISTTSAVDMTDPAMLAGFINFSTDLFPADDYGLILSNHGGGLEDGVINTDDYKDGTLELKESAILSYMLESALDSTKLYKEKINEDGKLGLIFYDACLMGSTEQAFNTSKYYRYMVASEERTMSYTDYAKLLNQLEYDVSNEKGDRNIAINLSKDFVATKWHGVEDNFIGSLATYSSSDIDRMYEKINVLSKELSYAFKDDNISDELKSDIFKSIRKASLSSYVPNASNTYLSGTLKDSRYVDIGEFYNYLMKNLNTLEGNYQAGGYDRQVLDNIEAKLNTLLDSGFMVYLSTKNYRGFGEITNTSDDEVIPLRYTITSEKNVWTDVKSGAQTGEAKEKDKPYASSIFIPLSMTLENFIKSGLYSYYDKSALGDYVEFIQNYLEYYNNKEDKGYDKEKQLLAEEMKDRNLYTKLITQPDGNQGLASSITDSNGNTFNYITFKVADSYADAGIEAPAHSTGSPMLDIIETCSSIQLTAVHREYFPAKGVDEEGTEKTGTLRVDMICAEEEVSLANYAVDSGTLSFDITNMTNSIIEGWSLTGNGYDPSDNTYEKETDWQFVLKSSLEKDSDEKNKAIKAIYSTQDLPKDENITTIEGSVIYTYTDPDNQDNKENKTLTDTFHVFENKDNKIDYAGTVQCDSEGNYTKVNDAVAISAYHYVLKYEKDTDGNLVKTTKEKLEGNKGFEDGYYIIPEGDIKAQLYLEKVQVTENIAEEGKDPEFSNASTGYMLDPDGNGKDYSALAYVSDQNTYEGGNTVGNGLLAEIDVSKTDAAFVASIGEVILDGKERDEGYAPSKGEEDNDDDFINKDDEGKESSAEVENSVVESKATSDEIVTVEDSVEASAVKSDVISDENATVEDSLEDSAVKSDATPDEITTVEDSLEDSAVKLVATSDEIVADAGSIENAESVISAVEVEADQEAVIVTDSETETDSSESETSDNSESEDPSVPVDAEVSEPVEISFDQEVNAA